MSDSAHADSKTHTWRPGAALFDRYQLLGVIGQGGMGTVYKAYHLSLKRFVAIKVLRIDQIPSPELKGRFMREMEAVGQMDHPNIVRASDAGKNNGVFYLVMEYLEGSDLSRLVTTHGALSTADACELTRQTAEGLDYIHRTLVHRDIKPSNLILTTSGVVKILDLGLARLQKVGAASEFTPTGSAIGTYDYLAPEQALASNQVDGRADIYSLGCTLFKLLSGRAPFPGPDYDSAARKLHAHGNVPLTDAPDFASVPEALRPILLRMMAKNPDDRYSTAREVADALAPFAADSQPVRLIQSVGAAVPPALRPLPTVKPNDLGQLTASPSETPVHFVGSLAIHMPDLVLRGRRRVLAIGSICLLACVAAGMAWFLAPKLMNRLGDGWRPVPPASDEVRLPLSAVPPIALGSLPRLNWHNLLGPGEPPTLIGYREGDGVTSGRWMPGRQQIEINPTDNVLIQLGADDRQTPEFTFEVLMSQRPWSGGVGLFWGYQEDAALKAAHQPEQVFASCQTLQLLHGQRPNGTGQFFIQRAAAQLSYDRDGGVALGHRNCPKDFLPPFGGEQLMQIVVCDGLLKSARFGDADLAYTHHIDANNKFQPGDYQGAFGVISYSSNLTIRQPRVMPHGGR